MIVGAVLGCSQTASVMAHPERVPDALQHRQIAAMMARRSGNEPMAYIF
jgi:methylase of polypeptide subunit release factors